MSKSKSSFQWNFFVINDDNKRYQKIEYELIDEEEKLEITTVEISRENNAYPRQHS